MTKPDTSPANVVRVLRTCAALTKTCNGNQPNLTTRNIDALADALDALPSGGASVDDDLERLGCYTSRATITTEWTHGPSSPPPSLVIAPPQPVLPTVTWDERVNRVMRATVGMMDINTVDDILRAAFPEYAPKENK